MRIGIIGGGPGGSVTAATLAKRGHEVLIFEASPFPRFRIGESLLPCNDPIFADIGLDYGAIAGQGFIPKLGAFFEDAPTGRTVRFPFRESLPGDPPAIFQVERARFDELLLDRACQLGAHLICPANIQHVDFQSDHPVLHHDGHRTEVDFVVDASGRRTLLARQLNLLNTRSELARSAVYGHVPHLPLAPGALPGDLVVSRAEEGWAWQIPLSPQLWSVGLVLRDGALIGDPATQFTLNLPHFPQLAQRLQGVIPTPLYATPTLGYQVRHRHGRHWAMVGDAAGFVDPIFASGVLLATRSGWQLAQALNEYGPDADLTDWRCATQHDLDIFSGFIRLWYDGDFISEAFFGGARDEELHCGIVSLLAGNTTNLSNRFLAMLARRDSYYKMVTPHLN